MILGVGRGFRGRIRWRGGRSAGAEAAVCPGAFREGAIRRIFPKHGAGRIWIPAHPEDSPYRKCPGSKSFGVRRPVGVAGHGFSAFGALRCRLPAGALLDAQLSVIFAEAAIFSRTGGRKDRWCGSGIAGRNAGFPVERHWPGSRNPAGNSRQCRRTWSWGDPYQRLFFEGND